jgi:hypothetical protein
MNLKANPDVLKAWSERTKCWMCKHKFNQPAVLPVKRLQRGASQPNINVGWAVHMMDTHGMPTRDYVHNYIFNSIYGIENTMSNLYGSERIFKFSKYNNQGVEL